MSEQDGMLERAYQALDGPYDDLTISHRVANLCRTVRREALEEAARSLESVKQARDPEVFRGMDGLECDAEGWRNLTHGERPVLKAGTNKIRALIGPEETK